MSVPTPLTNKHIVMLSGSARNAIETCRPSLIGNHSKTVTVCVRSCPPGPDVVVVTMSMNATTLTTNEPKSIIVASKPAFGSPSRRPTATRIRNPASGRAGINQIASVIAFPGHATCCLRSALPLPRWRSVARIGRRPSLALQLGEIVSGRARAPPQDRHDDAQADNHLGGGDDEHEEHSGLTIDVAELVRHGDEAQVDGIEHQLDAHEQHQRIAADQHADRADAEQDGPEDEV